MLIARPPSEADARPARIAVGIDGSEPSRIALELARELGSRLDVPVQAVAAGGAAAGFDVGDDAVAALQVHEWDPVEALLDVAGDCEVLILGARGLRGVRALGSVSERVAHRASASVLVVRGAEVATPRDVA